MVQRVVFLHEDLMKLPSFPRKALEAELDLHPNGEIGKVKTVTKIVFDTKYCEYESLVGNDCKITVVS